MIQSHPIIGSMAFCAASVAFLTSFEKLPLTHPRVSDTFPIPVPTAPRSPYMLFDYIYGSEACSYTYSP